MKILLAACNAKYIHSNLALYDLKAYAGEYGDHLMLREYTINQPAEDVLGDIYRSGADVICFSCYIWNISYVRKLVRDLGKILPDAALWVGGPEVSYNAEQILSELPSLAGVMVGEGEETFLELVRYYAEGKGGLSHIRGIVFRTASGIRRNGFREPLDLSSIPFPYNTLQDFKDRIIYYESSRGCPFSCSYCLSSVDRRLRFRDLEMVKRELAFFLEHKVPQVKFVDRTFNCSRDHATAVWSYIKEHDNGVTNFHFEISADLLTEEELSLIGDMRPGLIQLEIGVQSTNPRTVAAIRRTMDFEKLSRLVRRIHDRGNIHQHLDLIAGLPWEDYESFRRSFGDVYALKPQQLQLGFLKVLRGSPMREEAAGFGIVYREEAPYEVLFTRWLTYGDILKLKSVENMVEVYYNSGQFPHTLKFFEIYFPQMFDFYELLGDFYERRGYAGLSHSRMRRYEILLEFAQGYPDIAVEELAASMVCDMYLRENLKSRPAFAPSQERYGKFLREYIKKKNLPKTVHIEVFGGGRTVLFDYTRRDPLTGNARLEELRGCFPWQMDERGEKNGNV